MGLCASKPDNEKALQQEPGLEKSVIEATSAAGQAAENGSPGSTLAPPVHNSKEPVTPDELLILEMCNPDGVKHAVPVPLHRPAGGNPEDARAASKCNPLDDEPDAGAKGRIHNLLGCGVPEGGNDADRATWMKLIGLMNEPACPELDLICQVMCDVFEAPYGCITLFEDHQVWISNYVNGQPHRPSIKMATCPWVFLTPNPMGLMVEDIHKDARFAETVWVQRGVRAYVSSPLVSINGHRLGTICFADSKPHRVDASTARFMNNLAELAVRELEKFLDVPRRMQFDPELAARVKIRPTTTRSVETVTESCVLLVDTSVPGMQILYAGNTFDKWTGCDRSQVVGKMLMEVLDIAAAGAIMSLCNPPSAGTPSCTPTRFPSMPRSDGAQGAKLSKPHAAQLSSLAPNNDTSFASTSTTADGAVDEAQAQPAGQHASSRHSSAAMNTQPQAEPQIQTENSASTTCSANMGYAFAHLDSKSAALWSALSQDTQAKRRFILSGVCIKSSILSQPAPDYSSDTNVVHSGDGDEPGEQHSSSAGAPQDPEQAAAAAAEAGVPAAETNGRPRQHVALSGPTGPATHQPPPPQQSLPMFDMSFRPAALDRLDQDTYEVNIPTSLSLGTGQTQPSTSRATKSSDAADLKPRLFEHVYAIRLHRSTHNPKPQDAYQRMIKLMGQINLRTNSNPALSDIQPVKDHQVTSESRGTSFMSLATASSHKPAKSMDRLAGQALGSTSQDALTQAMRSHASKPASSCMYSAMSTHNTLLQTQSTEATSNNSQLYPEAPPQICQPQEYMTASIFSASHDVSKVFPALELARATHGTTTSSTYLSEDDLPLPFYGRTVLQAQRLEQSTAEVFSGLTVGHTIGRGGYAVVMHATWHDIQVAVKIQDHVFSSLQARKDAELEISIGQQLAHPNVLRTLAYASALLLADPADDALVSSLPDSHAVFAAAVGAAVTAGAQDMTLAGQAHLSMNHSEQLEQLFCAMLLKSCDSFASYRPSASMLGPGSRLSGLLVGGSNNWNILGRGPTLMHPDWGPGEGLQAEVISEEAGSVLISSADSKVSSAVDRTVAGSASSKGIDAQSQAANTAAVSSADETVVPANGAPDGVGSTEAASVIIQGTVTSPSPAAAAAAAGGALGLLKPGQQRVEAVPEDKEDSKEEWPTELIFPQRVRTWVVMEYGDGGTLQDAIDRGWFRCRLSQLAGPDMLAVLRVLLDIARGLEHLHEHGIVHADLSGFNVILCSTDGNGSVARSGNDKTDWHVQRYHEAPSGLKDGSACVHGQGCAPCRFTGKISDFGKAFRLTSPDQIIRRGEYGTITHMAPEVLRDQDIGQAADVYSVGVLMWSLYTGARPWAGLSHALIMSKIVIEGAMLVFPTESLGAPLVPAHILAAAPATQPEIPTDDAWFKELAVQCMAREASDRPLVSTVRAQLEKLHSAVMSVMQSA